VRMWVPVLELQRWMMRWPFKMNLYFQFLTQNQSVSAVDLVQLPALMFSGQAVPGKTKMSTGGKLLHSKFTDLENLSVKLTKTRFNELEVVYDVGKLNIGTTALKIINLNGVFYPSPTCEIWFPWGDFPSLGDRRSRQRKMNAKANQEGVVCSQASMVPCVFEVAMEIETIRSAKYILDNCAEWLVGIPNTIILKLGIFGCCDNGGSDFHVRLETHVPMIANKRVMFRIAPEVCSKLGEKFDDLHPVMFGAKRVCSELASVLGKDANLIFDAATSDFAVIRLNPTCDLTVARERAKAWLLPTIR
jgi:hypothetical protein